MLPVRVDFLKDVYRLPSDKIDLLLMGADDEEVKKSRREETIREIREKYNIKPHEFLIVTGGKIDNAIRQVLLLMEVIKQLKNNNVKLIVFESVIKELEQKLHSLTEGQKIQYIGLIKPEECYKLFVAANKE